MSNGVNNPHQLIISFILKKSRVTRGGATESHVYRTNILYNGSPYWIHSVPLSFESELEGSHPSELKTGQALSERFSRMVAMYH